MSSRANDIEGGTKNSASRKASRMRVLSCSSAVIALVIAQSYPAEAFDLSHLIKHHAIHAPHLGGGHKTFAPTRMMSASAPVRSFSRPMASNRSLNEGRPSFSDRTRDGVRENSAPRTHNAEYAALPNHDTRNNRSYYTGAAYTPAGNLGVGGIRHSNLGGFAGPAFSGFGFFYNNALALPFLGLAAWQLASYAALTEPELRNQQSAMIGATSAPLSVRRLTVVLPSNSRPSSGPAG